MSGLAEILLGEGFTISGSDAKESPLTRTLEEKGAKIYTDSEPPILTIPIQCCVHRCHPPGQSGIQKSQEMNLPMLTRAQLLGQIMNNYEPLCSCRNSRQNNHNLHDFPHSAGR